MKTILMLTDFSPRAEHATNLALKIASKVHAEIILYNAYYVPPVAPAETTVYPYYANYSVIENENLIQLKRFAERIQKKFIKENNSNLPVIHLQHSPGNLADNVSELAKKKKIWMIIMGDKSNEGALSRFIFGSDSHAVIDKAVCPVLLVPEKADLKQIKKTAFATDLQPSEKKAIPFLKEWADIFRSEILFVHVCDETLSVKEKVKNYDSYKKIAHRLDQSDSSYVDLCIDVLGEDIPDSLDKFTSMDKIDILAIQHKKRSFLGELFHTSISKKMMNYHHVPLLVLPEI
ncbi:MAG: universal stress protein [Sphingobacteriaceae bacterium]